MAKKLTTTQEVDKGKMVINTKTLDKEKKKVRELAGKLGAERKKHGEQKNELNKRIAELEEALEDARDIIDGHEAEQADEMDDEARVDVSETHTLYSVRLHTKGGDSPMDDIVVHGIIDGVGHITIRDDGSKTSKNKEFRFIESRPETVRCIARALLALADKGDEKFNEEW